MDGTGDVTGNDIKVNRHPRSEIGERTTQGNRIYYWTSNAGKTRNKISWDDNINSSINDKGNDVQK